MALGYTRNPTQGPPNKLPNALISDSQDAPRLQFVTTMSTVAIDEVSKRTIRKHASRYVYREIPQATAGDKTTRRPTGKTPSTAVGGQIHRFRLGPRGLKHTPNQPPQVSKNFTILSLKEDEPFQNAVQAPLSQNPRMSGRAITHVKSVGLDEENEDASAEDLSISAKTFGQFSSQPNSVKLTRWKRQEKQIRVKVVSLPGRAPLFGLSSGSMDPFNAMALAITPREQILFRHYFLDRRRHSTPLILYCQAWFGLACQDEAYFHAVLSHYSAAHRHAFPSESPVESISHLTNAIHIITQRLQDPIQSCSNGTIGAVASLIIYESANGALPSIAKHMSGLQEMVRRRGGLEKADFGMELKRLIAWTDMNTANDLWQKPRFPALAFGSSTNATSTLGFSVPESLANPAVRPTIDAILIELKSFAKELSVFQTRLNPLKRPSLNTTDRIHALERRIFDLIHFPPSSTTLLDHACVIAALIYMRSALRDEFCNFRFIEVGRLKSALKELESDEKSEKTEDLGLRDREKLVWAVGFGAVSAAGREEREWFVEMLKYVCGELGVERWVYLKAMLENVVWKADLDCEGMRVWAELKEIDNTI